MKPSQYKQLIKTLPCGIANHRLIVDPSGMPVDYEFVETNHLFEELTGFSHEEIKHKKASEVLPSFFSCPFNWLPVLGKVALNDTIEELEAYSAKLRRHFKVIVFSPEKYYFTTLFLDITPDKTDPTVPVCSGKQTEKSDKNCHDKRNKTEETCFFCLARDLSKHSDALAIFSKIFEFSPAFLAITSLEGTIVDANRAFLSAMEYEKGEVIGKSIEELQVFSDSGKEQHLISQLLDAGSAKNFDLTVKTKNGKKLHGIFSSEEIEIAGKPCFLTVMTDITDTKIANEALKDSEAAKASLLNSIHDLVFVFDDKLVFQECYAPPGAFLIDAPSNFIGKSFAEVGFPEPAYSICNDALAECLITGKPTRVEYYLDYSTNRYWYDLSISPYFNDRLKKFGLTCVARDVT